LTVAFSSNCQPAATKPFSVRVLAESYPTWQRSMLSRYLPRLSARCDWLLCLVSRLPLQTSNLWLSVSQSKTTRSNFTKVSVHAISGGESVVHWRQCETLCK